MMEGGRLVKIGLIPLSFLAVLGCVSCEPKEKLAAHSRAEAEGSRNAEMRMVGFCQKAHNLIAERRRQGKLDPSDILNQLLEMENSWDWTNPYTGQVSKVVVAPLPDAQGDMTLYLTPPRFDGDQHQLPSTIYVRCRVKGKLGDQLLEQFFDIE